MIIQKKSSVNIQGVGANKKLLNADDFALLDKFMLEKLENSNALIQEKDGAYHSNTDSMNSMAWELSQSKTHKRINSIEGKMTLVGKTEKYIEEVALDTEEEPLTEMGGELKQQVDAEQFGELGHLEEDWEQGVESVQSEQLGQLEGEDWNHSKH